ncbi:MAG: diaminopimelate decarboxylase [Bdellovibrionaceae bacterium]|nr:diaminopimelate decarboxylase [Bdellovibrionales bacterium]MCB9083422.1 diaminopimelate decarboxylase [Pseudobdellovibrionaceae bacterium]
MPFHYQGGKLGFSSGDKFFSLHALSQNMKRPSYLYCLDDVINRFDRFSQAFAQKASIHYAMKANSHPALLRILAKKGAGADVVSGGEIELALAHGFSPSKLVFSGVGKEKWEIELALKCGIRQINVESPAELRRIGQVARAMNLVAPVAFRLNPDVNPDTHPYIRTGFRENKFGMDVSFLFELDRILKEFSGSLSLVGVTLHIGSQIRDMVPLVEAVKKSIPLFESLKSQGHQMRTFDIGGGVGIDYHSADTSQELAGLGDYARQMVELLTPLDCEILCEPGRILVARAGVLLTEVQYVKETPYKRFAIVNSGMHHLMRPALYEAYHRILPIDESADRELKTYDVVGPICESSDVIGHERTLPDLQEGDWLAIMDAGAYGAVMASGYNAHPAPDEVAYYKGEIL